MSATITLPIDRFGCPIAGSAVVAHTVGSFVDGRLPHLCSRKLDGVAATDELLVRNARVVRSIDSRGHREVAIEGDGWVAHVVAPSEGTATLDVYAADAELAVLVVEEILARCPERQPAPEPNEVDVTIWHNGQHGPDERSQRVAASPWAHSARNYPPSVRDVVDRLVTLEPADDGGRIILLHGDPGTGTTSLIRTLLLEWRKWCVGHVVADGDRLLHDTGYLLEVVTSDPGDGRWNVVVIEDTSHLFEDTSPFGGDLSRLLNLSDGILGLGARTLFVLTTNARLASLHPAVVRAGRCIANIEFRPFSRREAIEWLGDGDEVPAAGLSLADLYERGATRPLITNVDHTAGSGAYL